MTVLLTKSFPRLWSLEAGVAMIVTDLHGDWDAFQRYRDCFVDLQAQGQADCLIFTGDLIHREDDGADQSLEIVLDIIELQASYGQAVICLCGNHELPHIYHISLSKGNRIFTPAFEAALSHSQQRAKIISFFKSLPFYLRTRAGVVLTHAGASPPLVDPEYALDIFNWNHQELLDWADETIAQEDVEALRRGYGRVYGGAYEALARYHLAVSGPEDPRYDDLLRGFIASSHPFFDKLLWSALFTRCEHEYGQADYAIFLSAMLKELSANYYAQQVLLAGHITIKGGHQIIAKQHLRLASAHHATPRQAGKYLLFDAAQPIRKVEDLLKGLGSVYK